MTLSFALSQWVTFLSTLALVSAFALLALRTLQLCIRTYAAQSICLALAALLLGTGWGAAHVTAIALIALAVKGFVIPRFLEKVAETVKIKREADPFVSYPLSLLGGIGLALLAYAVIGRMAPAGAPAAAKGFSLALTLMLLGLWLMVGRKKAMTQVIGLLVVENGLFTAALATAFSMPMIVELGLIFDLLIATLIMGLLIFRIQNTYASINTDRLRRLRG